MFPDSRFLESQRLFPMRSFVANALIGASSAVLVAGAAVGVACTPAQIAQADAVFNDIQAGCMVAELAQSVIPAGTPVAIVATDVQIGCDLADALIPDIEKVIGAFEATQGDAGPPAGAVYKPAPFALVKIRAKAGQ
jgi:hypothetical protein